MMPPDFEVTAIVTQKRGNLRPYGPDNPPPIKQPGQIARITKSLKEGIVDAAAAWGSDGQGRDGLHGYLTMAAGKYPKQYLQLLGRVLPMQSSDVVRPTIALNVVSIESGSYLSSADIERLRAQPAQIEHCRTA
jgi:hypothetical protein